MSILLRYFLASLVTFSLISCGGGGGSDPAVEGNEGETESPPVTTELEGIWFSCETLANNTSEESKLVFEGNAFILELSDYSDNACQVNGILAGVASGTFTIGNALTTTSGLTAKEFDSTILKIDGTSVNTTGFDIYSLSGENLAFGDESTGNGDTEGERPTDLDLNLVFTPNKPDGNPTQPQPPVTTTELEGAWSTPCVAVQGDAYAGLSISFAGINFERSGGFFNDDACTDERNVFSESGTFRIGESLITTSGLNAKNIDFTSVQDNGTVKEEFSIFSILSNNTELFFGDTKTGDESTPENRPTDVLMLPFTRAL